jgi:heat-inducible transcriptional repressor
MAATSLDDRSRDILRTLVQLHIATGEPVGSETLARSMARPLSSATLRNVMAELEKLGYLDQPHTSAGRLPTDEAYRLYVDALMGQRRPGLAPREAAAIDSELRPRDASPAQVMENASQVLSRLTHNVGFVLAPEMSRATFRHLDLVRLPHPRILVVMVSRGGLVTSKVIEVEEPIDQDDLQACANYLNAHFSGMSLGTIHAQLLRLMSEEKALYDTMLQTVVAVGQRAFAVEGEANVYLGGTSNILDHPEFEANVHRMRSLFKTFEEKSRLVKILNACLAGDGLRIIIGHEIPDPELQDLALVTATYPVDGDTACGVGVMGATRMEYGRVVALVDHIARAVSKTLEELR